MAPNFFERDLAVQVRKRIGQIAFQDDEPIAKL
jgi:hypothetical protein